MAKPLLIADPDLEHLAFAERVLIPALGEGETWPQVVECLETSMAQLWIMMDGKPIAAAVTEIGGGEVHFWLAGGKRADEWAARLAIGVCRATGLTAATIRGRIGWSRLLGWPIIDRVGKQALMRWDYGKEN